MPDSIYHIKTGLTGKRDNEVLLYIRFTARGRKAIFNSFLISVHYIEVSRTIPFTLSTYVVFIQILSRVAVLSLGLTSLCQLERKLP